MLLVALLSSLSFLCLAAWGVLLLRPIPPLLLYKKKKFKKSQFQEQDSEAREALQEERLKKQQPRVLILIAHPDDETMFFSPTISNLLRAGVRPFFLCLSTGDFYGDGERRVRELPEAITRLGADPADVTIFDIHFLRDGDEWKSEEIVHLLARHIQVLDVDTVISFDSYGISGHPNHIACEAALRRVGELVGSDVQNVMIEVLSLCSPSLFRKYSSVLSLVFSLLWIGVGDETFSLFAAPKEVWRAWRAMLAHRSQLVWFRFIYMAFSSLILTNSLRTVVPEDPSPLEEPSLSQHRIIF